MRLFTALCPPPDVVAAVAAALGEPGPGPRWSPPEDWHITLAYYGEADEDERAAELAPALAGRNSVDVRLTGPGTFPGVLWLGVTGEGLPRLAEAAGADREDRPYRPHLTLARFPRDRPRTVRPWTQLLTGFASRTWTAHEVVLMGGADTPGPRYRRLRAFPLRTPSSGGVRDRG
ncbi:RNA 2',3'-cyclic phosphodiesterase [Amycolatopsis rhabdoformis]|uniref:RNA 2',3'-cyclic phosphodiesterase n=1 Tax=Amycolatopsis rhabdoformis TaxID=1448059 RepID=A0ABZ1IKZ6_9PSEU|nr:RNA 2',3'-cyclic phosphodiesterase [Amycolatopsis rhabdoformis]WSE34433.1 RNA 2',3'-cyclic phosphodiesterase [Amycolatopsis rhabdoformis]